jgi:hypothetical protein
MRWGEVEATLLPKRRRTRAQRTPLLLLSMNFHANHPLHEVLLQTS